ncbi:sensor histidine kinase [Haloplanus aerogenes]|uniref:histidine kinase n=1 Tax=Haloplanus aerogenes TaxID=660522 RepID=A0A3M0DQU7_9EURY|nr:ATP-binding protein [Haloplanus aerogenes]AZH24383.1 PAS domain S-box protein [Haloplanus aerogenes]RMB23977.1 PAS domain S-box-containing protein [Haloplanus aerogenes]
MRSESASQRLVWAGTICAIGLVLLLANVPHLLREEGPLAYALGVFFPMVLASGLTTAGYWVYRSDLNGEFLPRVTAWTVSGIVAMAIVTAAMLAYQFAEGSRIITTHLPFVLLNLLTTGGLGGVLIGIYDGFQRQQQRLTEQDRQRYRSLLDAVPDAIFVARIATGEIIDANRTAEQLLDRPREDILGRDQTSLHPDENRDQYAELFEGHVAADEAVETKLPDGSDIHVVTAEGEHVPVEINASRFAYRDDPRFIGVFRDISDRRVREQELRKRTEQLEVLNRVIRHDIRNDMNVITGWVETLPEHVDEDSEEILDRIQETSHHVTELTEISRDYVEIISGSSSAELHAVSLSDAVRNELVTRRETYPEAEFRLEADLSEIEVRANELLSSVIRNLLNNAVQHNDGETPTVTIDADRTEESVIISVADDGPGIPDSQKETVFGKGEKNLDSAGTGIGLYLVKRLVDEFGGDVWIEDNDPKGAIFKVQLQRA